MNISQTLNNTVTGEIQRSREVSKDIGKKLFEILLDVEDYFYSDFWMSRFKRRLREEDIELDGILICSILGLSTDIADKVEFDTFEESSLQNGFSDSKNVISLNTNMTENELNNSHIYNLVMHEFGHKQYNDSGFKVVRQLNLKIFGNIEEHLKKEVSDKYFKDHNELRLRIVPIIREMIVNGRSYEEAYYRSPNLILDDIYKMYDKDYIIHLLKNIL